MMYDNEFRMAGIFDDVLGHSGVPAVVGAAGEAAKVVGEGARAAGEGIRTGAQDVGEGIRTGAGSVAESAATTAKWAIALAIGIPAVGLLALGTAIVVLMRGAQETAKVTIPALAPMLPSMLPMAGRMSEPMMMASMARGADHFAQRAGHPQVIEVLNHQPPMLIEAQPRSRTQY